MKKTILLAATLAAGCFALSGCTTTASYRHYDNTPFTVTALNAVAVYNHGADPMPTVSGPWGYHHRQSYQPPAFEIEVELHQGYKVRCPVSKLVYDTVATGTHEVDVTLQQESTAYHFKCLGAKLLL